MLPFVRNAGVLASVCMLLLVLPAYGADAMARRRELARLTATTPDYRIIATMNWLTGTRDLVGVGELADKIEHLFRNSDPARYVLLSHELCGKLARMDIDDSARRRLASDIALKALEAANDEVPFHVQLRLALKLCSPGTRPADTQPADVRARYMTPWVRVMRRLNDTAAKPLNLEVHFLNEVLPGFEDVTPFSGGAPITKDPKRLEQYQAAVKLRHQQAMEDLEIHAARQDQKLYHGDFERFVFATYRHVDPATAEAELAKWLPESGIGKDQQDRIMDAVAKPK